MIKKITIANNVFLFFGIYGGTMKPADREASGVLYYELDVLREEMKKMPEKTSYQTSEILAVIKLVDFMLFSLRDIGDYSVDAEEFNIKEEVYDFIVESEVLDKLGYIRRVLEDRFEDFPREGDKSFLEIIKEDIQYWEPKKET